MRSYGRIELDPKGKNWLVTTEPHVAMRLKRVFGKIDTREHGVISISATPETSRDLEWFIQRYAHEVTPATVLAERASEHREAETTVHKLLTGVQAPKTFDLKLPPREYQVLAAQMWLTVKGLLLGDEVGIGKAQPLNSKVLTPNGWKRMRYLRIGDTVVDPDGGTGTVLGIYPQGKRRVYDVSISDHSKTQCCEEHLWLLQTANDRYRGCSRILELRQFKDKLCRYRKNQQWRVNNYFLPPTQPVEFGKRPVDLQLHPYCMGLLLGDGGFTRGSVILTSADDSTRERFASLLPDGMELRKQKGDNHDWRVVAKGSSQFATKPNEVRRWLKSLGLVGKHSPDKFIPEPYLFASLTERIELLKGLMDSDGECQKGGIALFGTTSKQLRDDTAFLIRSVGGTATVCPISKTPSYIDKNSDLVICDASWTIIVKTEFNPFFIEKRASRWHKPLMGRAITEVSPAGVVETQCIRVSTKRNLYFTDDFIPTHNTVSAITGLVEPGMLPALVVTLTHLPLQWKREIERFTNLEVHILKTAKPYDITKYHKGRFPDVVISNYHKLDGWARVLDGLCKAIVFDEAHELRHPGSNKYAAAKHLAGAVEYKIGLSATPLFNYGGEMFNVMEILRPGVLGNKEEFHREWCTYEQKPRLKDPAAFGLYLREAGLMLRRTRMDVRRELKPVTVVPHTIEADPAVIKKMEGKAVDLARLVLQQNEDFKGQKMQASGEFNMRMRQATGIAKAPFAAEFVKFLHEESGEKIVLFAWHREVYTILMEQLKHLKPVMYTGSETAAQKEASRLAFVEGDSQVLIISNRSGMGLDGLQSVCRIGVIVELDWSPAVHIQNTGRIHRDGQDEPVIMYYLIADSGSDPVISDILGIKKQQLEGINSPTPDLIELLQVESDYVKRLAQDFLRRRGEEVTVTVDAPLF